MPSTRRIKVLGIALALFVFMIIYFTNDARRSHSQDFYKTTVAAMNRKEASDLEVSQKLDAAKHEAAQVAGEQGAQKPLTPGDTKPESPPSKLSGDASPSGEKSVAGRKKMKGGEKWDMHTGKEAAMEKDKEGKKMEPETKEDHEVEVELNSILRKGPSESDLCKLCACFIIFSKSYCPYSRKAKLILLEKYTIVPAPYVVELDQHPLGAKLQEALQKRTDRRTVPNVLINGRSIGGGDEVQGLDEGGGLVEKVKGMGGKRIVEARLTKA